MKNETLRSFEWNPKWHPNKTLNDTLKNHEWNPNWNPEEPVNETLNETLKKP